MAEAFTGEIRMFGGTFAPHNWSLCNGQLIAVSEQQALYSLLGTYYGGDGRSNFGLPDLRGRLPMHQGTGVGLSPRAIGIRTGTESVTITGNTMPAHNHPMMASPHAASSPSPVSKVIATCSVPTLLASPPDDKIHNMSPLAVENAGNNESHTNLMPYTCINFIICMVGTYPPRN
jgi:microcystin-dependent protein